MDSIKELIEFECTSFTKKYLSLEYIPKVEIYLDFVKLLLISISKKLLADIRINKEVICLVDELHRNTHRYIKELVKGNLSNCCQLYMIILKISNTLISYHNEHVNDFLIEYFDIKPHFG